MAVATKFRDIPTITRTGPLYEATPMTEDTELHATDPNEDDIDTVPAGPDVEPPLADEPEPPKNDPVPPEDQ